ncbi:FAD-dependent oxidoreductase [Bradyrhizobium sp. 200]|nr:FAD-dependent oxidoreductase [Bradyrhizobium sp. 200]
MPGSTMEPQRTTPVLREYDVVVLGGGPAGIAAAAAAARGGASTLLVERYGFLGGMGTAAGVTNFRGLHANVRGDFRRVVHGLSRDLTDRIGRQAGLNWPPHIVSGKVMAQAYDTAQGPRSDHADRERLSLRRGASFGACQGAACQRI